MDSKKFVLICTFVLCGACYSHAADDGAWSYSGDNGPEYWGSLQDTFKACSEGRAQTPINIVTDERVPIAVGPWELVGYDNQDDLDGPRATTLYNDGFAGPAGIVLSGDLQLSGGGLPRTYQAIQAHLHWGSDNTRGSEHTRDGVEYPAELHVVHVDYINYDDIASALADPEGLAVMGFFIEEGEHNSAWDPIFEGIPQITYPGSTYSFETVFALASLIPPRASLDRFTRYNGSLTTPGCYEAVVWTMFEETIKLSAEQIDLLRSLSVLTEDQETEEGREERLVNNYRPVQPINERTVYAAYIPVPEPVGGPSCYGRCNQIDLDSDYSCQCNAACQNYGDCCEDYGDNCLVRVCSYVHTYQNKERKQRPREMVVDDGATR